MYAVCVISKMFFLSFKTDCVGQAIDTYTISYKGQTTITLINVNVENV